MKQNLDSGLTRGSGTRSNILLVPFLQLHPRVVANAAQVHLLLHRVSGHDWRSTRHLLIQMVVSAQKWSGETGSRIATIAVEDFWGCFTILDAAVRDSAQLQLIACQYGCLLPELTHTQELVAFHLKKTS